MAIEYQYLLVPIVFFTLIFFKLERRNNSSKSTRSLPPGPWKLPFIGNIHNLIGDVPHRLLHQLAQKHGPLMHLQLGEQPVVVVSSADMAKQVMKTHDLNFASRTPTLAAEIMGYGCTNISFSPHGDYWRQLRRICTVELLSANRVESFRSLREGVFLDLVRWIASMEGSPIDLTEELYTSTYAFTVTAALGQKTKELEALLPIFKQAVKLAAGFDIADLFPSVRLIQLMSGSRRKLTRLHREQDEILEHIVRQHRDRVSLPSSDDLLDVLLKLQEDGLQLPLTDDSIKAVITDMLGGGSETSATTIDWAMAELLKNPEVLAKAQDEVRQVFDGKGFVDELLFSELKYLKAVVKETLRLHPPLPLLLPRKCEQTCEINGYEIPAETKVIINAWAVNRDPKYWENGDCFQPERFVESGVDYKGNNYEYIPFGAGRRICPGIWFGMANVELPLAMLLYHFEWRFAGGVGPQQMNMGEGFGITSRRNEHLYLSPVVARPLPAE